MQPALTPTRLVLRPLAADDGPHLADIFASAEVRRHLFDNQEVPPASVAALVEENLARPFLRKIGHPAFSDFCNTIGTKRTFKVLRRRSDVEGQSGHGAYVT